MLYYYYHYYFVRIYSHVNATAASGGRFTTLSSGTGPSLGYRNTNCDGILYTYTHRNIIYDSGRYRLMYYKSTENREFVIAAHVYTQKCSVVHVVIGIICTCAYSIKVKTHISIYYIVSRICPV